VKRHKANLSRQLVIVTGLSGSGKGSVLRTFEDLGYYCVDNLPVPLIPSFTELYAQSRDEIRRAALLVDAREGKQLAQLPDICRKLQKEGRLTLVFVEASTEALGRRFSETRRPHPMGRGTSVREGIRQERQRMAEIRRLANVVIDTTKFTVHELRQFIVKKFQSVGPQPLLVSVVSFGYRFGIPQDADLVFDVRFLPNPHFVPRLRRFSGRDSRVVRYIHSFPQTGEFLRRIDGLLAYLLPHYVAEGKSYLTIAIGCTGGRHRSVALAEDVRKELERRGYSAKAVHRDVDKAVS
jgi:RNase adapter protein RapZ